MEIYPVTYTRVQSIERNAKSRRKSNPNLGVQDSLNLAAQEDGFLHWRHVCLCREQVQRESKAQLLTRRMQSILTEAQARFPATEATAKAFAKGLVVAVDVTNAEALQQATDCREVSDGWYVAAADVWPLMLQDRCAELPHGDDSRRDLEVMDDFTCLRFFHISAPVQQSLRSFLNSITVPLQWAWVAGSATRLARGASGILPRPSRLDRFRHLIDPLSMSFIAKEEPHIADSSAFMFEKRTPLGQLRYKSVSVAFTTSWRDAQPVTAAVRTS